MVIGMRRVSANGDVWRDSAWLSFQLSIMGKRASVKTAAHSVIWRFISDAAEFRCADERRRGVGAGPMTDAHARVEAGIERPESRMADRMRL